MSLVYDKNIARKQAKAIGSKPRYEGQVKNEKWTTDLRYHADELGIVSVFHGKRRKDYRKSESTTRKSYRNKEDNVVRGFRAKMKTHLKRASNRPLG